MKSTASEAPNWSLIGVYDNTLFTSGDPLNRYYLADDQLYRFPQASANLYTLTPFRAYFLYSGEDVVPSRFSLDVVNSEGEATTIGELEVEKVGDKHAGIFTLSGQRLDSRIRGLSIENGKVVFHK